MRERLLAALLVVASAFVVAGVALLSTAASLIVAGVLTGAVAWLFLGEVE